MKFHFRNQIKNAWSVLTRAMLGMLLLCGSAHAASFYINVNTAPLSSSLSGPFSIGFQFIDGGVPGNNTAIVSDFNYWGGNVFGSPNYSVDGGVLGDLNSSVRFDNSVFFQEFYQTFTPGTRLSFKISLTSNVDGGTPDAFSFSILDNNLLNIPTTGLGDSLLLVNLDSASPSVQTFTGSGDFSGVTTSVPEPAPYVSLLIGVPLLILAARKIREAA